MQPAQRGDEHSSRREIDLALGALMGVRRCTEREAFDVMVEAVHATGTGLGEMSQALIEVISGAVPRTDARAVRHWAALLPTGQLGERAG
ncbi:ANTAR domain-containing protein [Mycobacterium sp. WMMD1722]|uniref:ANTAR domain-containing protein n=1 Tax=Mycobacterium sp. WMMD1722 TaxID=3404117 RepID=UPI003BF500FB